MERLVFGERDGLKLAEEGASSTSRQSSWWWSGSDRRSANDNGPFVLLIDEWAAFNFCVNCSKCPNLIATITTFWKTRSFAVTPTTRQDRTMAIYVVLLDRQQTNVMTRSINWEERVTHVQIKSRCWREISVSWRGSWRRRRRRRETGQGERFKHDVEIEELGEAREGLEVIRGELDDKRKASEGKEREVRKLDKVSIAFLQYCLMFLWPSSFLLLYLTHSLTSQKSPWEVSPSWYTYSVSTHCNGWFQYDHAIYIDVNGYLDWFPY